MHSTSPTTSFLHATTSNALSKNNSSIQMVPLTEQQELIEQWNKTQQMYPTDAYIPQLIARQSVMTPHALAIVAEQQLLSYSELNQRANQLAHYLQALGVGPNVLVGLCVERSVDMVIGMLGILKAGGAYVPLDPTYPSERLAFMLEDAQVPVLLTQTHIATRLPAHTAKVVYVDTTEVFEQQSVSEPTSSPTAEDLVYVIYTSGSTGRPKGVQITHGNLLNLLFWHRDAFQISSADRATQLTSPAFDATGWEIWPYLILGASIYLPNEDTRVSPTRLRDWLLQNNITISFLPTILAESVMELEWPQTTALRFLLTGADALHHYPSATLPFSLINNYGPTEATVVATSGCILPTEHIDGPPSIGCPIANTQVYILDEQLQQVSIGEVGELYIGGAGVAKGNLNRPELTAEKFIPDPFNDKSGARLYKTGDLVRYLADGQLAFVGRIDHQVKIRGYRIETNEIVSAINRHPSISSSVVVAHEDTNGEKRLVAYVVFVPDTYVGVTELRETLATQLPDYMIPGTFVVLESLPQTPNGKVARDMLPPPDETNTLYDEIVALPTTPIEEKLAEIMMHLLGLTRSVLMTTSLCLVATPYWAHRSLCR